MDPDTQIFEELKRVDTKAGLLFGGNVSLIAVTVAVLGLGHVPSFARTMMAVAQIVLLLAIGPLLMAISPKMLGGVRGVGKASSEVFGLSAWVADLEDDPVVRRRMLATRACDGYQRISISVALLSAGLVCLICAGVATAVAS